MTNSSIRLACIKTINMILARCFVSSQDASALVDVALHALSLPIGEGSEIRFLVFDTLLGIMTNCSIMQVKQHHHVRPFSDFSLLRTSVRLLSNEIVAWYFSRNWPVMNLSRMSNPDCNIVPADYNRSIRTHKRFFDEQLRTVDFVQASPYNFIHEGVDGFTILEVDPSH